MFKIEYRAVIKFLTKEGVLPTAIKQRLDAVYGKASPSFSTVKEWARQFRLGREIIQDEERVGRPADMTTEENVNFVKMEVMKNHQVRVKELASKTGLSNTTIRRILNRNLNLTKISAGWVKHGLGITKKKKSLLKMTTKKKN